mmetsp:Transcript_13168/g.37895  ORF Transcript_13168/g.37895 Transcript_13168/m.37895 type:complete len:229 (-) Transcript_13168:1310-1996(-)
MWPPIAQLPTSAKAACTTRTARAPPARMSSTRQISSARQVPRGAWRLSRSPSRRGRRSRTRSPQVARSSSSSTGGRRPSCPTRGGTRARPRRPCVWTRASATRSARRRLRLPSRASRRGAYHGAPVATRLRRRSVHGCCFSVRRPRPRNPRWRACARRSARRVSRRRSRLWRWPRACRRRCGTVLAVARVTRTKISRLPPWTTRSPKKLRRGRLPALAALPWRSPCAA